MEKEKNIEIGVQDIEVVTHDAISVYGADDNAVQNVIDEITKIALSIVGDVETSKGRDTIRSVAYSVSRAKTTLDGLGKEYVADLKAKAKVVDDKRKVIRESLDALRDDIRKPLTEWEEQEARKKKELQDRIDHAMELNAWEDEQGNPLPSVQIKERLSKLEGLRGKEKSEDEFNAIASGIKSLTLRLEQAEKREEEAAEIERLRMEKAKAEADKHLKELMRVDGVSESEIINRIAEIKTLKNKEEYDGMEDELEIISFNLMKHLEDARKEREAKILAEKEKALEEEMKAKYAQSIPATPEIEKPEEKQPVASVALEVVELSGAAKEGLESRSMESRAMESLMFVLDLEKDLAQRIVDAIADGLIDHIILG